jgi:hypothetical protein
MTDAEARQGLLDLETELAADVDHSKRDAIAERLAAEARAVKVTLDRGLAPQQADEARRMITALFAAHQVVRAVWQFKHKAPVR